jgi:hypothetical protein
MENMRKWKDSFLGFLGLWLIVLVILGVPSLAQKILVIITGLVIAFVSFRKWTRTVVNETAESTEPKDNEKIS